MSLVNEVDYSVIICTYNPDERLLKRCLNAVSLMDVSGFLTEIILVDNNSTVPLTEVLYVSDFLAGTPNSNLLLVKEQGLFYARKAGILAAKGKKVVFFDDDNEPEKTYIQVLSKLLRDYPHVAAWGPGNVTVDFIDGVDKQIEAFAREAFQEREEEQVTYANQRTWQSCYPFGTGLCVGKNYLNEYLSLAAQGKFTLSDRKGNQMSSGGDTQMVLHCISRGAAAGVAPGLRLVHIIPGKRTTLDYLKRLTYGTSVYYSTCMTEVFPDHFNHLNAIKERKFAIRTIKKFLPLFFKSNPKKTLSLVHYIGAISGDYLVLKKAIPSPVKWVLRRLKAV